jgi:hypothetical protein
MAIYIRDNFRCCYCGRELAEGIQLTLDHLKPYVKGGTHSETNLVTRCRQCNTSRGARPWRVFARRVAEQYGLSAAQIIAHIDRVRYRMIPLDAARDLLEQNRGFRAALAAA